MEPFLSVVVASLDGRELLPECLASLRSQRYPSHRFEVIVVDNGSTDGSAEWLARTHPDVVVVREARNLGFAGGTNRGADVARGECLVFLNNDAVAEPTFLQELAAATQADAAVASVAARILDWEGDATEFGGCGLNVFGFGFQRSSWHPDFSETGSGGEIPFACGAAMLVRTDVFRELGGFDPDFFTYYEDVDLGWRLWLSGYRVVYAPAARVRHRRRATSDRFSDRWRHYHWHRNALLTLVKNSEGPFLPKLLPLALTIFFARVGSLYEAAVHARSADDVRGCERYLDSAVGAAEGIHWVLDHFDALLEKRSTVQGRRRVGDRELAERLGLALDFGPEADGRENALALKLLGLIDLSDLLRPDRLRSATAVAASRLWEDLTAQALENRRLHRDLDARNREAAALHSELDTRNREAAALHRSLDNRNREAAALHRSLDDGNRETEALHRELDARNRALEETARAAERAQAEHRRELAGIEARLREAEALRETLDARLRALRSSRSWRWTAPLRALLDVRRRTELP